MTTWLLRTGLPLAIAFGSTPAQADQNWSGGYAVTRNAPVIFKAVPSVGVPAQTDAPLYKRGFSAGSGVFEVRGDFDPDRPGEEWSALPAFRIVVDAYGNRRRIKAGPEHYTAVRWRKTGR